MKHIGESIREAIDWTQDHFQTTRPIAEYTLFSMMAEHAVEEWDDGFVLLKEDGEIEKHHTNVKHNFSKNWKRFRFHSKRKNTTSKKIQKHPHLDNSSSAEAMMAADDEEGKI